MPQCCVCEETFASENLATFGSETVCINCKPIYVQGLKEGVDARKNQHWRDKRRVVLPRAAAVFPPRCVACNAATPGPAEQGKCYWCSPLALLGLVAGLPGVILLYLLLRKKIPVQYYLCARHRNRRLVARLVGAGSLLLLVACLVAGGAFDLGRLWLLGLGQLLFALVVVYFVSPPKPRVTKVSNDYVWLTGSSKAFRESLPEMQRR